MTNNASNAEKASSLSLPMVTVFTVNTLPDRTIAHALDFDIVAVGNTKEEALRKLRAAVKTHVQYGLNNSLCKEDIQVLAPDDFWSKLTTDSSITIGEAIEIDSRRIIPMLKTTTDEPRPTSFAA